MAAAAKCRLLVAVSRPLDYEGDPGVCIGKENHIGVMDFEKLQEVGQDYPFRTLKPFIVAVKDLDAGDLSGKVGISLHLDLQAAQWYLKVGREPGFISVSAGEEVFLGQIH
jgi:hypothetical protein